MIGRRVPLPFAVIGSRSSKAGMAQHRSPLTPPPCVAELETPDRMEYTFLPVTAGSILFKVQAPNDAHVALASGPNEDGPMYEVSLAAPCQGSLSQKIIFKKQKSNFLKFPHLGLYFWFSKNFPGISMSVCQIF